MKSAHMGPRPRRALAGVAVLALAGTVAVPLRASAADDPIAPGSPAPESKIQGNEISGATMAPNSYFVEFASAPTSLGGSERAIQSERSQFEADVAEAGIEVKIRSEFGALWNGVSVDVAQQDLLDIASSDVVEAVYPMAIIDAPQGPENDGIDPDLFSAVTMTGADVVQSELGFTGSGIKVGVIDTGIDIDHPDLGGNGSPGTTAFPSDRVPDGHDFVGDDYNADPSGASYQPRPKPDSNPDDCQGHGTHVAGIVGASGEVTGVAPDVTFGAYRVFGCGGSTEADIMLRAMEASLRDGMDVVNLSIGSAFSSWQQYPTSQATDALAAEGVAVFASIGNEGDLGLHAAGAPGVGHDTIGVGSVDNTTYQASVLLTEAGDEIPYAVGSPAPEPPTEGEANLVSLADRPPGTVNQGCNSAPFTEAEQGVIDGNWVLIQRGGCTFHEKGVNAQNAGAAGVVMYNNQPGSVNPSLAGEPPVTIPYVSILQADGEVLYQDAADGTTITWTEDQATVPNPTGGLMSGFSSHGPTADMTIKPDLSAPGGQIYSTYPLEKQSYATLSGTSMAAPHAAGAAALMLEADSDLSVEDVRLRLQNSSVQLPFNLVPAAGLDLVHKQGAGMIQVDDAILANAVVEPGLIQLGQQLVGESSTSTVTITNVSDSDQTYQVSHEPAVATVGTANDYGYYLAPADVTLSAEEVTVPAGGSAAVDLAITSPTTADGAPIYGGYVRFTAGEGEEADVYTVAYGGSAADLQETEVLADMIDGDGNVTLELPALAVLTGCEFFLGVDCVDEEGAWGLAGAGHEYTMANGDVPTALVHFEHQARHLEVEAFESAGGAKGESLGLVKEEDYLARSAPRNGFQPYTWDGKVISETGARERVPAGEYLVEFRVTKASAWNDDREPGVETWTSPEFNIAWGDGSQTDSPEVDRAHGTNRYSTAAELAVENFDPGVDTVYLASGRNFPDALSGGALAGSTEVPVLLTHPKALSPETRLALRTLKPAKVVILGGTQAVSGEVATALEGYGAAVDRIAGDDRYESSAEIAAEFGSADTVFVASGADYPDALSASAAAGVNDAPVLLTRPDRVPEVVADQLAELGASTIVLVGGEEAVSGDVEDALASYGSVHRVSGENRYGTSAAIALEYFQASVAHAMLATGADYPDALAAGPVAAQNNSPVLLTRPDRLPASVLDSIVELRVQNVTIVGGWKAVTRAIEEALEDVIYPAQ